MAVSNYHYTFWTPGAMLAAVFQARLSDQTSGYTNQTVVLGAGSGYRQMSWTSVKGGNSNVYFFVLISLASTELAMALFWTNSGDWQQNTVVSVPTSGSNPITTFAAMLTFWQQNYVAFKQALIDNWTISFISSQLVHSITAAANAIYMAAASYQITCDSWVYTDASYLGMCNVSVSPAFIPIQLPVAANAQYSWAGGMNPIQAQQLIAAAQQIADTDYNISINHGQSIFSVKGKVLT